MTFAPGLEALAWHTADVAESAYAQLARRFIAPPRGTIEIVLTDNVDFSNGAATPFPSNRIFVYAKPPVDDLSLGYYHDWIDLVVTHELTHILHLDATGWLGRALRQVFGRVPSGWPLFPAVFTPQWNIEGLATHEESRLTGFGRVNGSFFEMMLRTAVLERRFEPIDRATGNTPIWPDGTRPYLYGSRFFDYLDRTHGDTADAAVARRTAGALVPPTLWFDRVGQKAIGWSFTTAWQDWRRELERGYAGLADSLAALGLTQAERLTEAGRLALYPRVSPDGRRLAFAADDGRSDVATRVLELETGRQWKLARRNGLGPSSWLPDGSGVLTGQLEFRDPYHIFADLYRVTGAGEARLTRGGRLAEPDLAADGRRVAAVENRGGDVRLVLYEIGSGRVRPLTSFGEAHWSLPRWAPDGNRIAAGRWRDGNYDVVVLDTLGEIVFAPAGDRAIDAAPAWSPDGRYLLFWSDRSGIPNLYGYDLSAGEPPPLLQVTNVLTGAFYPDVSPDARWIYYSGYHADGFHIERIPFDPAAWRPPPPLDARFRPSAPEPLATRAAVSATRGAGSPPRRYSPWATLLPRYWLPVLSRDAVAGNFYGAYTAGQDLVGRHAYEGWLAFAPDDGHVQGAGQYTYRGFGNPVFGVEVSSTLEGGLAPVRNRPDTAVAFLLREHDIALFATLRRSRWRSAAALTAGADYSVDRLTSTDPKFGFSDPEDELLGAFAFGSFAYYRVHAFSVSREDGFTVLLGGRRRWERGATDIPNGVGADAGYSEATGRITAYRAISRLGFANQVLAGRASAVLRTGPGAGARAADIGGAPGSAAALLLGELGGAGPFLPLRGFRDGVRAGTRAWTASVEARLPVAIVGRGFGLWPVFLDRVSAAAFLDAGDAWCSAAEEQQLAFCTRDFIDSASIPSTGAILLGAGTELALDFSLFYSAPLRLRAGLGYPVRGPGDEPVAYLQFGSSF